MERFTEQMLGDGGMTQVRGLASGMEHRRVVGVSLYVTGLWIRLQLADCCLSFCALKYKQVECKYVLVGL